MKRVFALSAVCAMLPSLLLAQGATADQRVEKFRDWMIACIPLATEGAVSGAQCELTQQLIQPDGQRVLSLSFKLAEEDSATLTAVTPFGLDVLSELGVSIADDTIASVRFQTCLPVGCVAMAEVSKDVIEQLSTAEAMQVTLPAFGGERIDLTVSLLGFGQAWQRLPSLVSGQ